MSHGVGYALLACILWGVVFFLFKFPVNILGPILTSFIIEFIILICAGFNIFVSKEKLKFNDNSLWKWLIAAGFFTAIGTIFYNLGINIANISLVSAIAFSNPLVASIMGAVIYKEKLGLKKYLGILLVVLGIFLLSFLS